MRQSVIFISMYFTGFSPTVRRRVIVTSGIRSPAHEVFMSTGEALSMSLTKLKSCTLTLPPPAAPALNEPGLLTPQLKLSSSICPSKPTTETSPSMPSPFAYQGDLEPSAVKQVPNTATKRQSQPLRIFFELLMAYLQS